MMTTFTIKINEKTKAGKAFRAMTETFLKNAKGIEIIENPSDTEEKVYNLEFLKMIKARAENIKDKSKWTLLDPNDVWGSLGLR